MPLTNFHSARVKSSTAFKMLPGKKKKRIAKGVTKKNEVVSLSDLADTLRDKLREAV